VSAFTAEVQRLEAKISELEGLERERTRDERALREAVQQWHATFDAVTDAVCLLDAEGRIQRCNGAMVELLETDPSELSGRLCWEVMHGTTTPINECPVVRMHKSGRRETTELPFRDRWFSVTADPLRDGDGQITGAVHLMRDISEQKQTQDALQESESRYRSLFENSPVSLWHQDLSALKAHVGRLRASGVEDFRAFLRDHPDEAIHCASLVKILDINSATLTLFKASNKVELVDHLGHILREEARDALQAEIGCIVQGKPTCGGETVASTIDGQLRYVAWRWAVVPGHEQTMSRVLVSVADITAIKQAEQEHRRLQEQAVEIQKLDSLEVLAGGVAHDFNNILMGVFGYAGLSLDGIPPGSPARSDIEQIKSLADRAADLAKQMLAYSGRGHFVVEPVSLDELVADMVSLLESSCARMTVLEFDFESETHAIMADATQVRQIVMNLVINAHEASEDSGDPVVVRTRVMDCDSAILSASRLPQKPEEGTYICLEVCDRGSGMDEDAQARMFDPFFTTKFTGRGLGLSAVLGIVRGHHGAIMVDSVPEEGTTVRVLFPAHKPPAVQPPEKPTVQPEEHRGTGTILLVDDEAPVRRAAKRMLENRGFGVITAADGREAIEVFGEHRDEIDCVLLDLSMPRMAGQETYRLLREASSEVRVILSSGYSEEDALRRFDTEGLAGFIQKPYAAEKLVAMLREVLARR